MYNEIAKLFILMKRSRWINHQPQRNQRSVQFLNRKSNFPARGEIQLWISFSCVYFQDDIVKIMFSLYTSWFIHVTLLPCTESKQMKNFVMLGKTKEQFLKRRRKIIEFSYLTNVKWSHVTLWISSNWMMSLNVIWRFCLVITECTVMR